MNNFSYLDYSSIVPTTPLPLGQTPQGEFATYDPLRQDWGSLDVGDLQLGHVRMAKINASLNRNICLQKRDPQESTTVDTCIFLQGTMETDFSGIGRIPMSKGMQNFIYKPDAQDDHYVPAQQSLHILHLSVDRQYYAKLLSESEKWSAELREKLLQKKLICGRLNMMMTSQMFRTVYDALNCPLRGNLRSIVIESKVIEFLALQLDQFSLGVSRPQAQAGTLKTADRDTLHALREYLEVSFTRDHSLRTLARTFALNEFKLKKGFKELFGTTVFDYLHDLKMDHARKMLEDGNALVSEASSSVGYRNPNHFSTAFKRKFGVSPALVKK
jgi:AraC-like DNA-binding protein